MKIQENISLKPFTTFGIDKKAKFFARVSTLAELKSALIAAKEKEFPVLILVAEAIYYSHKMLKV